MNHKWISI